MPCPGFCSLQPARDLSRPFSEGQSVVSRTMSKASVGDPNRGRPGARRRRSSWPETTGNARNSWSSAVAAGNCACNALGETAPSGRATARNGPISRRGSPEPSYPIRPKATMRVDPKWTQRVIMVSVVPLGSREEHRVRENPAQRGCARARARQRQHNPKLATQDRATGTHGTDFWHKVSYGT